MVICCYVHDRDATSFSSAFGIGEPRGEGIDWFLWQDKGLIGPERAFQHCWSLFPDRDVIVLHPDMSPLHEDINNSWYRNLLEYADALPDAGIIACDLLFPEKTPQGAYAVQCAGGVFIDQSINYIHSKRLPYDHQFRLPRSVQWATFGGVYIRRSAIDSCGDFDSRYVWAYVMDVDYSLEVRRRGYKIYQVPVNLIHEQNGSTKEFLRQPAYAEKISRNQAAFQEKWRESELLAMAPEFEYSHRLFREAEKTRHPVGTP